MTQPSVIYLSLSLDVRLCSSIRMGGMCVCARDVRVGHYWPVTPTSPTAFH